MNTEQRIEAAKAKLDALNEKHALAVARATNPKYRALMAAAAALDKCDGYGVREPKLIADLRELAREDALRQ